MTGRAHLAGWLAVLSVAVTPSCGEDRGRTRGDTASPQRIAAPSTEAARRLDGVRTLFPRASLAATGARFEGTPDGTHLGATLARSPGVRRPARVSIPIRAAGEVELEDERSRLSTRFALLDTRDVTAEIVDGIAIWRDALALAAPDGATIRADVIHRVSETGTEDLVVLDARPATEAIAYTLDASRVAGLRLVADTLELLDDTGTPALRVAPPYVLDARGRRHAGKLAISGCAHDTSPAPPWGRRVTPPGAARCTFRVSWAGDVAYPAVVDPSWTTTGAMATPRSSLTASLLSSGRVLFAGGEDRFGSLAVAEIYDPAASAGAGAFAATGSMGVKRGRHVASTLPSGKVLVAGGCGSGAITAEIYDPGGAAAGTFTPAGSMPGIALCASTATLLGSGKVLVAGGEGQKASLLFDPTASGGAGAFAPAGAMGTARARHAASLLASGKVLVSGGEGASGNRTETAEIFDPAGNGGAGSFGSTGSMATARASHTSARLASGKVLVAGGSLTAPASAEIFDPVTGAFTPTGAMASGRRNHTASVLAAGNVLVVAGYDGGGDYSATVEMFDPAAGGGAGAFLAGSTLATGRAFHSAIALSSGRILVAGGNYELDGYLASAEVFGGLRGDPCSSAGFCLPGTICADGYCCDTACEAGPCDRCDLAGKEGTCVVAPAGDPGGKPGCGAYVCDGVVPSCPSSCASDAACEAKYYCAKGACTPRRGQGSACGAANECESRACVDGLCCDRPCASGCEACAAHLKQSGTGDGACGPIKDGTDPRGACVPSGVVCGVDGECNGTGGCRLATPAGVACSADGKVCDGSGKCTVPGASCDGDHTTTAPDGGTVDCAPFKCDSNGTCRPVCTSVADCVPPAICDFAGRCVAPPGADGGGGCAVTRRPLARGDGAAWLAIALVIARVTCFLRARASPARVKPTDRDPLNPPRPRRARRRPSPLAPSPSSPRASPGTA